MAWCRKADSEKPPTNRKYWQLETSPWCSSLSICEIIALTTGSNSEATVLFPSIRKPLENPMPCLSLFLVMTASNGLPSIFSKLLGILNCILDSPSGFTALFDFSKLMRNWIHCWGYFFWNSLMKIMPRMLSSNVTKFASTWVPPQSPPVALWISFMRSDLRTSCAVKSIVPPRQQ